MKAFAQGFLNFNAASPTPFHVCKNVSTTLEANGFTKIYEDTEWLNTVKPGGKYYFTRNGSSLCAFVVGAKYKSGNGFKLMGAHTDSPVLKVKPISKREGYGVELVGVETYGGGLWHTWFDRDLGVAGRVMIKNADGETFTQELVHIKKPILRIATLCIHLQTAAEKAAFAPNVEDHLVPILSSLSEELSGTADDTSDYMTRHPPKLLTLLGQQLGCDPADIVDFELTLCPTEAPVLGGAAEEFIFAPRLDNQLHCYVGSNSFISVANENDTTEEGILLMSMFDHEEVGSGSNEGAGSPLIRDTMERLITLAYNNEVFRGAKVPSSLDEAIKVTIAKSILFSTDCTHAIHPNYPEKHEIKHQNKMGYGPVISTNTNQKFSTNGVTGFFVRQLARQTKVGYYDDGASGFQEIPIQEFNGRNDQASGSTIGPHLASGVGLRTVDVGISHISMHSIREQCATKDLWSAFYLFRAFFKEALKLDARLSSADKM